MKSSPIWTAKTGADPVLNSLRNPFSSLLISLALMCCITFIPGCKFIYRRSTKPSAEGSGPWRTFSTRDFLPGNVVLDILETASEDIYLATWNGITRVSRDQQGKETWRSFGPADGLPPNNVTCLAEDANGAIWASCGMAGNVTLVRLDNGRWNIVPATSEVAEALIVDMDFDRSGVLWLATWGSGVFTYDGNQWDHFTDETGLPSNFTVVVTPGEDEVWIGTKEGKGASRFHDGRFETFDEHNSGLVDNNIHAITFQGDSIWFGSWGGANRVNAFDDLTEFENWNTYASYDNRLPDSFIRVITVDQDNVWFGTAAGLTRFNNKDTWTTFTTTEKRTITFAPDGTKTSEEVESMEGLASDHIFSLLVDSLGRLWVGTDQGVSRYTL